MKNVPIYQKQHKVSQVYLKQFGYEENGEWWISVYECGTKATSNIKIVDFTKEINVFDLPFEEPKLKRHFENNSNKIENHYLTIISNLNYQNILTAKNKDVLNHFVANILCRTSPFRCFINDLLIYSDTREKFINEITMFSDNSKEVEILLQKFKIDYQLNIAIGYLMNHLVHIFRRFKKIILKCKQEGWLTTDSPVYLDKQGNSAWIIPLESEIYMPLSKDYCLFMFHPKSKFDSNSLRFLMEDKVNYIDFETFNEVTEKIVFDYDKYLIFNTKMNETNLTN